MAWRNRKIQRDPLLNLRWTILPPQFYETLLDSTPKNVVKYANGKLHPCPSFFEVDYVFFLLPLENNEWLLARLELSLQELVYYPCENVCVGNKYINVIHPRLTKVKVYLGALLMHLRYWQKTGKPEKCISAELNDNYVVSNTLIAGNEAVYLCMLMEHLVTDKPINITRDICKTFLSYRQFIVEKLYFWRCLPRPNVV
ncbi:hypothetical protein HanPI659440_Chr06g0232121 [Helianthus annuus]|nr:hypothetical protein HanPI659440_Chr06g0232121 [Helianthus annuus]